MWREAAAATLAAARRKEAGLLMDAALPALHAAEGAVPALTWHDFEDLRTSHIPLRPLVHLFYCLGMVWPLYWDKDLLASPVSKKGKRNNGNGSAATAAPAAAVEGSRGGGEGGGGREGEEGGEGGGGGNVRELMGGEVGCGGAEEGGDTERVASASVPFTQVGFGTTVRLAASSDVADVEAAAAALILGGGGGVEQGGGGGEGVGGGGGGSDDAGDTARDASAVGARGRSEEDGWLAAAMAASALETASHTSTAATVSSEENHPRHQQEQLQQQLRLPPEPPIQETATAAAAARRFMSDDEIKIDLDNATWRAQAWSIVVEPMLQSPRFPSLLLDSLRLFSQPDRLAKLRASTGSADDMEARGASLFAFTLTRGLKRISSARRELDATLRYHYMSEKHEMKLGVVTE